MRKKMVAVLLVVVLSLTVVLTGCQQDAKDTKGEERKPIKIGVNMKSISNPFYLEEADGMKSEMKEGDEFILTDSQEDHAKQVNDVEDLIQQGCDVIFISPVDWQATRTMLESAKEAGIPVILIDQNVPEEDQELVSAIVVSDNVMAGELIAESMIEAIGTEGEIVLYENTMSKAGVDRMAGFESYMKDYPGIKVVNRQDGIGQIEASLPVMENMLQANPDIDAVFAFNDPSAIGCISAIESAGALDKVKVFGVDGSPDGMANIKEGKMYASALQFPFRAGAEAVKLAYDILDGKEVTKYNPIPVELVDINNIDEYLE